MEKMFKQNMHRQKKFKDENRKIQESGNNEKKKYYTHKTPHNPHPPQEKDLKL